LFGIGRLVKGNQRIYNKKIKDLLFKSFEWLKGDRADETRPKCEILVLAKENEEVELLLELFTLESTNRVSNSPIESPVLEVERIYRKLIEKPYDKLLNQALNSKYYTEPVNKII